MAKQKQVLNAALKALLAGAETSAATKIPATFISELASLPDDKQKVLAELSTEQFNELLNQSELATINAAASAADAKQIKAFIKELIEKVDKINDKLNKNNDSESENKRHKKKRDENEDTDKPFDVFLIHSHVDEEVVEQLGVKLEDIAGFRVWLDKWILVPGGHWQQEMATGIEQTKTCTVCIGRNTPTGWFREEIEKALNRQAKDASFRVIPVILPGGDESLIDNFLELRTWVRFTDGIDDSDAFHGLMRGIKGLPRGRSPIVKSGFDLRVESTRKALLKIQSLRDVLDDEIAFEYQRKLLDRVIEP